jgi:crossover junction endodeoxyribonuclease RuvC
MIIGIDPGASGALVIMENNEPIEWMRMPTMKIGSTTRVNAAAVAHLLQEYQITKAYVENVHSMPKQGVASSFNFGHSCGVVEGVVAACGISIHMVTPQTWKKRAGLIGQDKDAARSAAIRLWPQWPALHKKLEGQAMADAALIAIYGDRND